MEGIKIRNNCLYLQKNMILCILMQKTLKNTQKLL